ncbi:hypothetical protein [Pseudonocardia humida]|uniref:Secreted protein with PEP-CTERM sorting signal n=1 Tax=Pseudonocardia humida TaxID=2800819 RepID=A0ABT1ABM9_9PSEU|nr:hypothetical protein [Pseudonocardia humida]MCO1660371.1 hypothetical protein [Pseudonocardia humida]
MTWLGTFLIVAAVVVVLGLVAAALLDRRARAQGRELRPLPVRDRVRPLPQRRPLGRRRPGDRPG